MKIESLREVPKAKLSKIVNDLPEEKSVVITKNGWPWHRTLFRNCRHGS